MSSESNYSHSVAASTPSPAATTSTTPATSNSTSSITHSSGSSSNASRRPPRKSTLTQQQKNQKRQRATQDQLITLEVEFSKNPTPTAATRERIASEINMTERSVQIWFQNSRRRAKIKAISKKGIDAGEDLDESMRQLLAIQAMESGKPFPHHFLGRSGGLMAGYGMGGMPLGGDQNGSGKVVIQHFNCRSLSIGSWRRVGQNAMDLVIFYSPDKACITYYINNDSAGYKIEFPFAFIKNITLEPGESQPMNGSPPRSGGLVIELTRPPHFFMDSSGSGGFFQCGDFTEDQQASQVFVHHLGGNPKQLSGQLAKLVSLDVYQNRHNSHFDMHPIPASAPVSPTMGIPRPASQPNVHFARPHPPHVGMFQEAHFGVNPHLQHVRMHGGHKRQRSRSVPAAIDFSMLHGPMPTFHIQQPSPQFPPGNHQHMFHPMPQNPAQIHMGSGLQIDTSAPYDLAFRQMPMSATATSPSEFASPGFYPTHPQQQPTPVPAGDYSTPYTMPFLSPSPMIDPSSMIPQSVSPHPHMGHSEPAIADNSPPMTAMHRSASADMFTLGHNHAMNDESLMLSEMYSKQNLNLQMPGAPFDENSLMAMHDMSSDFHSSQDHLDLSLNGFGTVDPNSLQSGLHS